jgi:multicomponent K+:H+ antiporter subunit E
VTPLIPFPLLWTLLVAMWLALTGSLDLGNLLLAGAAALVAVRPLARLLDRHPKVRKPLVALALLLVVFADILRSNVAVAAIVLGFNPRKRRTGFVDIPLTLREPAGLAVLACIVTSTPGTAWAGYASEQNVLTIHVFDLLDEHQWIDLVRERYERRLLEIFA